ncbi:acyl-CoA N-acyltransferase [Cucurbitaria berberidis CBS 394.84]|uniref:Acyl-CoA N-acyltransferase n=1 Tax=Cucurbitaria berberidis CBS 394.84 TaxID=1168544 RepID=A0A9P4GT64_9PLEO|nr:acyl-CoA N-acyltransferase [Cucurbitaria berberidis CBS 394.84]KAF1850857.1 acyl-CoA N-acyltransferase [Cucurbitaria berberidis CBS 394.84]
MAISVREVSDDDIPRACEIELLAYKGGSLSPILAPGPFPPDSWQQRIEQVTTMRKEDPTTVYLQAFDGDTGKMVAFAKWHVFESSEAAAKSSRPLSFGAGRNKEACQLFFGGMAKRKKEIMGDKPHLYLHMLHTDPEFQGRGAGGMLVDWGSKKADELGLPVYLESSIKGHRFYQKHGFEDVDIFKVDFSKFGGPLHEQPLMVRKPLKLS